MSGLAMQAHASSRPASGAEHQFSHLWEMEGLGHDRRPPLSHGFKVGVGSVAIAALYERLLERDLGALDVEGLRRAWPGPEAAEAAVRAAHTTPGLDEAAVAETMAKHADPETLDGGWSCSPTAGRGSAAAFRNSSSRPRGCGSCWPRPAARPGRRSWG